MTDIVSRLLAYPVGKDWRSGEEFLRPDSTGELVSTVREAAAYIERLEVGLLKIATYPLDSGRCTNDGYPSEVVYDEYAYKRMVDSYRKAARNTLKGGNDE